MTDEKNSQQNDIPPNWGGPFGQGFDPNNPYMAAMYAQMQQPMMTPQMFNHQAHMNQMNAMAMQQAYMMQQVQQMQKQMQDYQQAMALQQMQAQQKKEQAATEGDPQAAFYNDPIMQQAQAMLDGAMGEEEAGMFKEILGSLGMNDKEFWKGALVGAAAALILSNENVRKGIMNVVSSGGEMLKSGGASVKEGAMSTASAVKENVGAGKEIFTETYQAGKTGFKESVARHKEEKSTESDVPAPAEGDVNE